MAKKIKGPVVLNLRSERARISNNSQDEIFCRVWDKKKTECAFGVSVIADDDYYNLLYQNGEYMGLARETGGIVYPFSYDYTKKGSRFKNRKIQTAKVVCISKSQNLEMWWGTPSPLLVRDKNGEPFRFGARGSFFVEIDPADHALNADIFYRKCLTSATEEGMPVYKVKEHLLKSFANLIGEKVQDCLEEMEYPLEDLIDLTAKEKLKISANAYDKVKKVFAEFGLTLVPVSKNCIVTDLHVNAGAPETAYVAPRPTDFF